MKPMKQRRLNLNHISPEKSALSAHSANSNGDHRPAAGRTGALIDLPLGAKPPQRTLTHSTHSQHSAGRHAYLTVPIYPEVRVHE